MNTIKPFKMSLLQATNVLGAFQRLSGALMPARLSFIAARNLAALAGDPDVIGAEQARSKLIRDTYGVKKADGNFGVPPEKMAAFQAAFAEVGANFVEIKLQVFPEGAIDHFPPISPSDLLILEPFMDGQSEPVKAAKAKRKR